MYHRITRSAGMYHWITTSRGMYHWIGNDISRNVPGTVSLDKDVSRNVLQDNSRNVSLDRYPTSAGMYRGITTSAGMYNWIKTSAVMYHGITTSAGMYHWITSSEGMYRYR